MARFAVVNQSTLVSDDDLQTAHAACLKQLTEHVAPAWGRLPMDGVFVPKGGQVPPDAYPVYVIDDPDVAKMLGYHSEDPSGKPYGHVFAGPILQNRGTPLAGFPSVSAVLSHEVIEFFIDPTCSLYAVDGSGTLFSYEVADPVEGAAYAVLTPDGAPVSVSDFVFEAWFDAKAPPGTQYDWLKNCSAPFHVTKNGYAVTFDPAANTVTKVYGCEEHKQLHDIVRPDHPGARSARRLAPPR
jgi:hypothetical protein